MANSRVQIEAEDWVRREWMSKRFNLVFNRERLRIKPGGQFDFDAVSGNGQIAAVISTNGGITASGRPAMPKLSKIRSDILFLLMANVQRPLVILTDKDMYNLCMEERANGRMPTEIEFFHSQVPEELELRLKESRQRAAEEVTPR